MVLEIIGLTWLHFLGDFLLQEREEAKSKSSSNKALAIHCAKYSVPLMLVGFWFAIFNGLAHFCVDYVSSRVGKNLYLAGKEKGFFTTIGADQAIHLTILYYTYGYMFN